MKRDKFILDPHEPLRQGQRWTLKEPWQKHLPITIEILKRVILKEGDEKIEKWKFKEISVYKDKNGVITYEDAYYRRYGRRFGQNIENISDFMLSGDILTFYEQI